MDCRDMENCSVGALAGEALNVLLCVVVFGGKPVIPRVFVWYNHPDCPTSGCAVGPTGAGHHCVLQGNCSYATPW